MRAVASRIKGGLRINGVPNLAIDRVVEIVDQKLNERIVRADLARHDMFHRGSKTAHPNSITSLWTCPG